MTLGFNNIVIKPQISSVLFSFLFFGGILFYLVFMVRFKPKSEIENSRKLCIIECFCVANFLELVFIYALCYRANLQILSGFKTILFVFGIFLNISIYVFFKVFEFFFYKNLFKDKMVRVFLIIEFINLVLFTLFFENIKEAIYFFVVPVFPLVFFAVLLFIFKYDTENDKFSILNIVKEKAKTRKYNIINVLLIN